MYDNEIREIVSEKLYLREIEGYIRFFIDENDVYWYNYDELANMLMLTKRAKDDIYKGLNNYEKTVFSDSNYIIGGNVRSKFITTDAVSRIINRNNRKANNILKTIINNESTDCNDYSEFDSCLNQLYSSIRMNDTVGIVQSIRDISTSDTFKDTLCKYDRNYKREYEDLVDEFRNYIYDDYYDEIEIDVKLCKRKESESYEERELEYKRNKNNKLTCPSWIRNVVK